MSWSEFKDCRQLASVSSLTRTKAIECEISFKMTLFMMTRAELSWASTRDGIDQTPTKWNRSLILPQAKQRLLNEEVANCSRQYPANHQRSRTKETHILRLNFYLSWARHQTALWLDNFQVQSVSNVNKNSNQVVPHNQLFCMILTLNLTIKIEWSTLWWIRSRMLKSRFNKAQT